MLNKICEQKKLHINFDILVLYTQKWLIIWLFITVKTMIKLEYLWKNIFEKSKKNSFKFWFEYIGFLFITKKALNF